MDLDVRVIAEYDYKNNDVERRVQILLWDEPVYEVTYGRYDGSNSQIEGYTKRQFVQLLADALKKEDV